MLEIDYLEKLTKDLKAERQKARRERIEAYLANKGQLIHGKTSDTSSHLTREEEVDLKPLPTAWQPSTPSRK